jgi:hypothetical protein
MRGGWPFSPKNGLENERADKTTGPYELVTEGALAREVSKRRSAILYGDEKAQTYEAYLADVGHELAGVPGLKESPFTGRQEILYCRRNGYIADKESN